MSFMCPLCKGEICIPKSPMVFVLLDTSLSLHTTISLSLIFLPLHLFLVDRTLG